MGLQVRCFVFSACTLAYRSNNLEFSNVPYPISAHCISFRILGGRGKYETLPRTYEYTGMTDISYMREI